MTTAATSANEKADLRKAARARRDALSKPFRAAASSAACRNATGLLTTRNPACLSAFVAIQSEIDPSGIVKWAHARGVTVALPVTDGTATMVFRRYLAGEQLVAGGYGTQTPAETAPQMQPDALIVPLLAFDRRGGRLGYGAGYYDRAITKLSAAGPRPFLLGVAFSAQEVQHVPTEPHDAYLDAVVTEQDVIVCGASE